jgi:uncharacterized protein (TIGR02246 family)
MRGKGRIIVTALAILAAAGAGAALYRSAHDAAAVADEKKDTPKDKDKPKDKTSDDEAAVRKTADAFAKAFDKGDAKAVAALWTEQGEFVGPDGETLRGRKEIEKGYAEFFEKNPKAKLELRIESIRLLGKHTALEEGSVRVTLAIFQASPSRTCRTL